MHDAFYERNYRDCNIDVFLQKLFRSHGFRDVANELFERYSLHFRNALVRACYRNVRLGVEPDFTFINAFMEGLLRNEATYPFRNRDMAVAELYASTGMLFPAEESSRIG